MPPELPPKIVFNRPNMKLPESNIGFGVLVLSSPSSSGGGGYKKNKTTMYERSLES